MRLWELALERLPLLRLGRQELVLWVVLGIFFVFHLFSVPDPDFYWHLRTGQYIVETGAFPSRDPFSFTAGDRTWILHEWGAQLILYGLHSQFSFAGVVWFFSLLSTFALYLQFRLLAILGVHKLVAAVWVYATGFILWPFFSVRPLTFTWLFVTIYLLFLYPFYRGRPVSLWPLPLLMVAWVNLHGGFIMGVVLMGSLLGVQLIERRLLGQPHRVLPLARTLALTILATALHPSGPQALFYPLSYLGTDNASLEFITEWQSPNFHEGYWLIVLLGPLLLAQALGVARQRLGIWPFVLWTMVVIMGLQSVRHIPLFALVGMTVLGEVFKERLAWARSTPPPWEPAGKILLHWVVLLGLLGTASAGVPQLPLYQAVPDPFGSKNPYPEQGATWIATCYPQARMYNLYWWGGYLLYRLYPQQRVFIDGRADLYGAQLLREYMDVSRLEPRWRDILDRYQINLVIFLKEHPLTIALDLDPAWKRVFLGAVEAIYVRTRGGAQELAEGMPPGCT